MNQASSHYELDRSDYEWALAELDEPRTERGVFGAASQAVRLTERLTVWGPAAILLFVMGAIAVYCSMRFGVISLFTLVAVLLVPLVPALWVAGAWLLVRWESLGVDGPPAKAIQGAVLKRIDQGKAPLPLGRVTVEWDENALRVSGDPHAVSVTWTSRPIVRRVGDRVLVLPFVQKLGTPDVSRMAIIRTEGFPDNGSFEDAIAEWSTLAQG